MGIEKNILFSCVLHGESLTCVTVRSCEALDARTRKTADSIGTLLTVSRQLIVRVVAFIQVWKQKKIFSQVERNLCVIIIHIAQQLKIIVAPYFQISYLSCRLTLLRLYNYNPPIRRRNLSERIARSSC